ncbi:MAG: hypothetical protein AAGD33_12830 [Actinomycetota bacterium]
MYANVVITRYPTGVGSGVRVENYGSQPLFDVDLAVEVNGRWLSAERIDFVKALPERAPSSRKLFSGERELSLIPAESRNISHDEVESDGGPPYRVTHLRTQHNVPLQSTNDGAWSTIPDPPGRLTFWRR